VGSHHLFIHFSILIMIKAIEAIVILVLLLFSFLAGVKYSAQVKERASWLFETPEEEIELPDIEGAEETAPIDAEFHGINIEENTTNSPSAPMDVPAVPAEDAGSVTPAEPVVAPALAPAAPAKKAPAKKTPAKKASEKK
jgi:hypothetical protein